MDMPAGVAPVCKVTQEDDDNLDNLPTNDIVRADRGEVSACLITLVPCRSTPR